jgi:DMSO/TMAO reductase YedYZ molybdopterin-dependent catalytic subunit
MSESQPEPAPQAPAARVRKALAGSAQPARPVVPLAPVLVRYDAFVAAALAVLAALAGRFIIGLTTPAELFGDRLTALIPLPVFSTLLSVFGTGAKHLFYGFLLLGEGVLTAVAGAVYWSLRNRFVPGHGADYRDAPVIILLLWLVSAGILAPLIGGGFFGAGLTGGIPGVFGSEFLPHTIFALAFITLLRRDEPAAAETGRAEGRAISRRRLLQQAGFAAAVVAGGALAWDFISAGVGSVLGIGGTNRPALKLGNVPDKIVPPPVPTYGPWTPVSGQSAEVTSANDFYYVSKNLAGDPTIAGSAWKLSIGGMVTSPYSLSYADLKALPTIERYHTLECISNEVGGNLMSSARFTGVSLADVLNRAGIQHGASELIFHAADGYSDSLHLSQALDPRSLVVYLINGAPLPQPHGYPARLLVPGLYGMKNCKWLTSVELGSGSYTGYWEQQGWTREARVKMTARIDVPHDGDLLVARPTYIAGVAYSGDKGIAEVQVSTDSGQTWQPATLRRPLGPLTWVLWEYAWTPPAGGQYVLAARAIALDGTVQTANSAPPLPDGSSGYDAISVVTR